MKKRLLKILIGLLGLCAGVTAFGWFGPVNQYLPLGLYTTRPHLKEHSKNLLLGNPQHHFQSPWMLEKALPAWKASDMIYGLKALDREAKKGNEYCYEVYTEEEKALDPWKEQVSLYCLHGDQQEKRPFVLLYAGGGFSSVCSMQESLPVGAWFQEQGYTVFMGTYRIGKTFGMFQDPNLLAEDVAAAVRFITEHADELNVEAENYLIGGFSAGSCTAFVWCNKQYGYEQYDLPAPAAAAFIYGIPEAYMNEVEVPSFIRWCVHDPYFGDEIWQRYLEILEEKGVDCDFKAVEALHGFGLGTDTPAYGWTEEAEAFWKQHQ